MGNAQIIAECKGFEDTRSWTFYETLEEAKANLGALVERGQRKRERGGE